MTQRTPIVKMSGAGNDFIVLDEAVWETLPGDRATWVRGACRRGLSVGADGVLVVGPGGDGGVRVVFFNPDGGEAFCGNGTRCAARYAVWRRLVTGPRMTLATAAGPVPAVVEGGIVSLRLPPPEDRGAIELKGPDGDVHSGRLVIAGVPHLVLHVPQVAAWPLDRLAPILRRDPALGPEGANVDIVARDGDGRVHVRTFERGVEGETLACGSGAIACALARAAAGAVSPLRIETAGGDALVVRWQAADDGFEVWLAGPAEVAFTGNWEFETAASPRI